jgi:hypothetical protein
MKQTQIKATLRTWNNGDRSFTDSVVLIDRTHDFASGPYQDTVPFAVGSNQEVLPID